MASEMKKKPKRKKCPMCGYITVLKPGLPVCHLCWEGS